MVAPCRFSPFMWASTMEAPVFSRLVVTLVDASPVFHRPCVCDNSKVCYQSRIMSRGNNNGGGTALRLRLGRGALWWLATQQLKAVDIYLGDVVLNGVFVLPCAGAQFALDIEFSALANVSLGHFGIFAPHHNIVPLSAFGHLHPVGVGVGSVAGCQRK